MLRRFNAEPASRVGNDSGIGVLLVNLGTPREPTPRALRAYLRQFLWDPRVVEQPRLKWWLILHLLVLTRRPRRSAALYEKIWTTEGSPLLVFSRRLAQAVQRELGARVPIPVRIALGMRYGEPSIDGAVRELKAHGCRRLLCLPLYPQYCAATTGSTFDALARVLSSWRRVPELRTINDYHDEPAYLDALAESIGETWSRGGRADRLVFSFHGLPLRCHESGDPYSEQCRRTASRVAERLGLAEERYVVAYQSRFGKERWLEPATDSTVKALVATRDRIDVICPGFAADCLETLEEIGRLNEDCERELGRRFRYLACLNDRPSHARAIVVLIGANLRGWLPEETRRDR